MMKKLLAEFTGTYALVFCGTGSIVVNELYGGVITHLGIAMSFGLIVMAMIYAFGDISGAHMNPAVTLAFAVAKRLEWKTVFPFVMAQMAGAIAASFSLAALFPLSKTLGATLPSGTALQSFIFEAFLSFLLMLVILRVSSGSKEKGIVAGIIIGAVVGLEALFAGPVCGASMNPARSLAPAMAIANYHDLWVYFAGPVLGMLAAVGLHHYFRETKE